MNLGDCIEPGKASQKVISVGKLFLNNVNTLVENNSLIIGIL